MGPSGDGRRDLEKEEKRDVLCPVALDDVVRT